MPAITRLAAALVAGAWLAACGAQPGKSPMLARSGDPVPGTDAPPTMTVPAERLRYVALGDSYTIGTSVTEVERWPNQLTARLPQLELVANLGVNGFTSRDLIEVELPKVPALRPDVVTVLIGVNDVVQGVSISTYRDNLVTVLRDLVAQVGAARIVVLTIPDYTVTPQGAAFGDPAQQSGAIREFNAVMTQLATANGIAVVDIYDISLEASTGRTLVAGDGLHPSGTQYGRWVERIAPVMESLLAR